MEALSIANEILPMGSPFIALFCLVPLYIALYKAKDYRTSCLIMAIQTITTHLISSFWLANFHGFGVFTLGASALGTAFEGGLCGVIMHIYPSYLNRKENLEELSGHRSYRFFTRILWFTSCWVFWEWEKSTGDLAYSWGTLFQAAYRMKLIIQIADVTGVWGITFLFALFNGFIGQGLMILEGVEHSQNPSKVLSNYTQCGKFLIAAGSVCFIYGLYQYFIPRTQTKEVNTIIVQPNGDPWAASEKDNVDISKRLTLEGIEQFREEDKESDLVLWSEGILTHSFPNARNFYRSNDEESLCDFIAKTNTPFIIGGHSLVNRRKYQVSNSAVLFDSKGNYSGFYNKIHLVPFAEGIPYSETAWMKAIMGRLVGMSSGWTKGYQYVLFKIPVKARNGNPTPLNYSTKNKAVIELDEQGHSDPKETMDYIMNPDENPDNYVAFTTPICFEDAFTDVCTPLYNMGSEVFMNITNDSWSKTKSAEYQHFINASYLSIEYRSTLVRCCNSGYSVVVAPNGKIIQDLPLFEEGVMAVSVPVYERKPTIFSRYGDWFAYLVFAFMGIVTIISLAEVYDLRRITKIIKK